MRILLLLIAGWLAVVATVRADDEPLKQFDGHTSLTTADFTVPDGWELRWRSNQVLSVGVIRRDNTVVGGTTGTKQGSLYLPQGGSYRIRVKGEDGIPWDVSIYPVNSATPSDSVDYFVPSVGPAFKEVTNTATATPPAVPLPVVAPTPPPPPPPAVPTELSAQQMRSLVSIHGDRVQGTGFFMKTGTGIVVVTAQQLIANNPNVQVLTSTGAEVKVTKIQCASDRDVAMLSVADFGFPALEQGDPAKVNAGDAVLTGSANGAPLPSASVDTVSAGRIEADDLRPVIGGPLVLARTGQVVGMVDVTPQVLASANFTVQDFEERDALADGSGTAFGQRLDNVAAWDTCDAAKLQLQAQFLDAFHRRSRCLDAYLNNISGHRAKKIWQADDKVKSANDTFLQDTSDGDPSQRVEALHALLFELGVVADTDTDQIRQSGNFYTFEQARAKDEIAYRQAIKNQLDGYSSDVKRLNGVVIKNN